MNYWIVEKMAKGGEGKERGIGSGEGEKCVTVFRNGALKEAINLEENCDVEDKLILTKGKGGEG